jgi:hypothetical protein
VIIDEDPTGQFTKDQPVCPGKIPPHDDCEGKNELLCLVEGFGDALGFLYDTFAQGYETYKSELAKGISSLLPGCSDSDGDWCKKAIKKGVDYGASYLTGLPPTMPLINWLQIMSVKCL